MRLYCFLLNPGIPVPLCISFLFHAKPALSFIVFRGMWLGCPTSLLDLFASDKGMGCKPLILSALIDTVYRTDPRLPMRPSFFHVWVLIFPTRPSFSPSRVLTFPMRPSFFPTWVLTFSTRLSFFPTWVLTFLTRLSFFPTRVLTFPTRPSFFPTRILTFPARPSFFPEPGGFWKWRSSQFFAPCLLFFSAINAV